MYLNMISCYMYVLMLNVVYLPSLSCLKCDWRACGSKTLISRLLMPVFQFLMPGRKVWSKVCLLQSLPCVCGHVCVVYLILACTALFCVGTRSEVSPVFLNLIYIYIYICCVKKRYRKKAVFLHWYIFVKKQLFYKNIFCKKTVLH